MTATNRSLVDFDAIPKLFTDRVAKASELMTIGLTSDTVYSRCRPGGPWQRLLPGVVLLGSAPPTRTQLARAALRYAGTQAVLTGHDALAMLGVKNANPVGPVHLLIPITRQVRSDVLVRVERTTRMPAPLAKGGMPVAPVHRAVLDAARRLGSLDAARALIAECVQRRFARPDELRTELERGSNRGSALPRRVLTEVSDGVHSAAEAWGRQMVGNSDLPKPQWNMHIRTAGGTLLGVVDAWWEEVCMAWEIDAYEYHLSPQSYANTVQRGAKFTAAGVTVVHTLLSRIRLDPKGVLAELRQAYTQAAARPRPPIVAERIG